LRIEQFNEHGVIEDGPIQVLPEFNCYPPLVQLQPDLGSFLGYANRDPIEVSKGKTSSAQILQNFSTIAKLPLTAQSAMVMWNPDASATVYRGVPPVARFL
jgi:hypothetical protein